MTVLSGNIGSPSPLYCNDVLSGNAIKMSSAFANHFKELQYCNAYQRNLTSKNCKNGLKIMTLKERS